MSKQPKVTNTVYWGEDLYMEYLNYPKSKAIPSGACGYRAGFIDSDGDKHPQVDGYYRFGDSVEDPLAMSRYFAGMDAAYCMMGHIYYGAKFSEFGRGLKADADKRFAKTQKRHAKWKAEQKKKKAAANDNETVSASPNAARVKKKKKAA